MRAPNLWDVANGISGFLLGMMLSSIPYAGMVWIMARLIPVVPVWLAVFPLGFSVASSFMAIGMGEGRTGFWMVRGDVDGK